MKHNDITDIKKLTVQNMENIFNVYSDENDYYFYNLLKTVYIPSNVDPNLYNLYMTVPKDTWPLISYKHYNTINLWWVICAVNQITNPIIQPPPNIKLRILTKEVVRDILVKINKG